MTPKNKLFFLFILPLLSIITACEVDRLPETTLSDESFWKSENDIKLASNYFYSTLPTLPVTTDVWSDNAIGTGPNSISDGSRIPPATDGNYNGNYTVIRAANNLIEKSAKAIAAGVASERVNWYVSEVKYFRARAYFQLLQRFGGVPLITSTLDIDAPELQSPQANREQILDFIYADLNDAILKIRTATQLGAADYGRISKTAVLSLKAQVGLFEGTRSKFHGYGDPIKHLTIARDAAKLVMQSGEHSLFKNYFQLLQYEGEGFANKETILVRQYGKNVTESIVSHTAQRNLETGAANPTKSLADSYLMIDGLPITQSSLYKKPTKAIEEFANRDPRMSDRFFKKGDPYIGTTPVFNIPPLSFVKTGYANRSYANITDWVNSRSYIDYPITRYAEILLIYAEATFELTESISDADLNISINALRQRPSVNMPKLTNAFVLANNLDMRTEIRRERRVELALEGSRYWDLIRWKTAEIELPKDVLGSFFYAEYGTSVMPLLNPQNYIIAQRAAVRRFDPARDYLWPFPINELALNQGLKQNPNW